MTIYFISDPAYAMHDTGPEHPEQPNRSLVVAMALEKAGFKTAKNTIRPYPATKEDILLCHTPAYFDLVQSEIAKLGKHDVTFLSTGDTVISEHSFKNALLAVGGVLCAVDQVFKHPSSKVFCIVRPPGHHACSDQGMGFCLFNNVAIGARYAQKKYGVKRVLIVDWDVHHGNGTQQIFNNDPTVFYFSTHEKGIYPGTGTEKEIGEGEAKGTKMNYPIMPGIHSRVEVIRACEKLKERMQIFKPEIVFISAGFDAHENDVLGHFNLTDEDFFTLTQIIKSIAEEYAEGKLISVLEGGYYLPSLANASIAHVKGMID